MLTPKIGDNSVNGLELQAEHLSDISPLRAWKQLRTLNVSGANVLTDLSPLEGMPLTTLFVSAPLLTDLSPLRGMSLQSLYLAANSLADITPLAGLPLKELGIDGSKVSDLSPLKGAPLERLSCGFTNVNDLTPLQGMPLSNLQVGMTRVTDLSPLRGMRFKSLNFADCPVSDLSPLAGTRINDLDCSGSAVSDLSPLKDVQMTTLRFTPIFITRGIDVLRDHKSLKSIVANGRELAERDPLTVQKFWEKFAAGEFRPQQPSPLPGQPAFIQWTRSVSELPAAQQVEAVAKKLQELNPDFDGKVQHQIRGDVVTGLQFDTTHVTDISPVRALPALEELTCTSGLPGFRSSFSDLSPLNGLRLKMLEVAGRVTDLSPLAGMPLERLDLAQNPITDLSPLKGMPLTILKLGRSCVSDLSPLKGLGLEQIDLRLTDVTDLSPLKDMPLRTLNCDCTRVADLSPLAGVPLESLWVCGTPVSDLRPLADVPLTELYIANNRVSDITPLGKTELRIVQLTPRNITRGLEVLRELPLVRIEAVDRKGRVQHTPAEFFARYAEGAFGKPTAVDQTPASEKPAVAP